MCFFTLGASRVSTISFSGVNMSSSFTGLYSAETTSSGYAFSSCSSSRPSNLRLQQDKLEQLGVSFRFSSSRPKTGSSSGYSSLGGASNSSSSSGYYSFGGTSATSSSFSSSCLTSNSSSTIFSSVAIGSLQVKVLLQVMAWEAIFP